jgi:23S rRNA (cytidine2498-2'-O)-methyltransferase
MAPGVSGPLPTLLAQCREGFEPEAGEDLLAIARAAGVEVRCSVVPRAGHVVAAVAGARVPDLAQWSAAQRKAEPVFARTVCYGIAVELGATPGARADRVTPLVDAARRIGAGTPAAIFLEYPDTNEGKALSTLARALEPRLRAQLGDDAAAVEQASATPASAPPLRLHVFLCDGSHAIVGVSEAGTGSRWPMGIPRLRVAAGAPSRSARKLAEAFVTFLGDDIAATLQPGMRAVDLGAAPGGWSWLLARHGLRVTAVDNGPLKGEASADPLITHLRVDGLHYRPRRSVDWVTCDIVEAPARIAALMGKWIAEGHARRAMFNLKLPMKRRHAEVERCRAIIDGALANGATHARLRVRQLYHDREEVTACLAPDPERRPPARRSRR